MNKPNRLSTLILLPLLFTLAACDREETTYMVGTLERGQGNWTLITDPEGGVHRVEVGNFLGRHHGKIVEMTDTYVAVVEIVSDGTQDGWVERPRTIKLTGM